MAEETLLDLKVTAEQICFKSPLIWSVNDYRMWIMIDCRSIC
jgi:hypothetical protein